ncbi:MAG TPA: hypothetical protein ENK66_10635 [Arcobacter sp.]|nr:hypothetical protein [Arcobacter sp.]
MDSNKKEQLKSWMGDKEFLLLNIDEMNEQQINVLYDWGLKMFGLGQYIVADIDDVKLDGRLIILDDGTYWEVDEFDIYTSNMWSFTDKVVVIDDEMYKLDDMEKVSVSQTYF